MQGTVRAGQFFVCPPWYMLLRNQLPSIRLGITQILGRRYKHVLNSLRGKSHGKINSGCKVVKRRYSKNSNDHRIIEAMKFRQSLQNYLSYREDDAQSPSANR